MFFSRGQNLRDLFAFAALRLSIYISPNKPTSTTYAFGYSKSDKDAERRVEEREDGLYDVVA